MKETIKTSRTAGYLEKIFRVLNEAFFDGEIETPIITIQSTPRAYGHVTTAKAWSKGNDGELRRELNIGAGTLARPIENVVATMLHEMVHLYHLQNGIQDCSRGGSYHNKIFKEKAESVGLIIQHDPRYGWTITEPSDSLVEFILEQGWTEISMNRNEGYSFGGSSGGAATKPTAGGVAKKGNSRKYVCPGCRLCVRATKDMTGKLLCVDCGEVLVEE